MPFKQILNIPLQYQRVKKIYLSYERWLMPTTLLIGFLVDYLTFTSIKINFTFAILTFYWLLAGLTIIFINLFDTKRLPQKLRYLRLFAPLVIQFTFGALLGGSLVFYWLSGALSVSWPIILIVAILMIFNDIFRHRFLEPTLQISVYFFITFSLSSFVLPLIFKSLSPWLFVLSGAISLAIAYPYIRFLPLMGKESPETKKQIFVLIFSILIVMNLLYFTNIIPPIPLSLREAGLYHTLTISNGKYIMEGEPETFGDALLPGQILHIINGQPVYFYTAIFAPDGLRAGITHHWEYYDRTKRDWVNKNSLSFNIVGGRREGYKGYSYISNLEPGTWRIYVENEYGQVLGRMQFNVEIAKSAIELQEVTR